MMYVTTLARDMDPFIKVASTTACYELMDMVAGRLEQIAYETHLHILGVEEVLERERFADDITREQLAADRREGYLLMTRLTREAKALRGLALRAVEQQHGARRAS